jgi:hypothetical protein
MSGYGVKWINKSNSKHEDASTQQHDAADGYVERPVIPN